MRKRRELFERVEAQRIANLPPTQHLPGGGVKYAMGKRTYTYYDFLQLFLWDRIPTLSLSTMRDRCEDYCDQERDSPVLSALLGFHDVIEKVLKNHVASTREQRKRLLRHVTIAYACCRDIVRKLEYARFKKGLSALRRSIDEPDGTERIRHQPIPSDCVEPYKP
jgi:hypothetical protein